MAKLQPVDKVEIQVLVDNATDVMSTTPSNVENEFAFATRRGLRASSGRCLLLCSTRLLRVAYCHARR